MDRLLSGHMSLREHQSIVYGWNSRQASANGSQTDDAMDAPTAEQWDEARRMSRETVARADERRAAQEGV